MMIQVMIYVKEQLHGIINFGWVFLPKIYHTYSAMIKFGTVVPDLNKIQKHMNHVLHPKNSATISLFSPLTLVISRNTDIDRILIHSF